MLCAISCHASQSLMKGFVIENQSKPPSSAVHPVPDIACSLCRLAGCHLKQPKTLNHFWQSLLSPTYFCKEQILSEHGHNKWYLFLALCIFSVRFELVGYFVGCFRQHTDKVQGFATFLESVTKCLDETGAFGSVSPGVEARRCAVSN